MERYQYDGIRPHVRAIAAGVEGSDPARVELIPAVRQFNDLLCQAVSHHNRGNPEHVPATLEACRPHLADLEAAHLAARAVFDQVAQALKPPPGPEPAPLPEPEDEGDPDDSEGDGLDDTPPADDSDPPRSRRDRRRR